MLELFTHVGRFCVIRTRCATRSWLLAIYLSALVGLIGGCSKSSSTSDATLSAPATETLYLGKEADNVAWLLLRPSGAAVLLTEPCGVQEKFHKAKVFNYESGKSTPVAEHSGCYNDEDREMGPQGKIKILDSDGVRLGNPLLEVPVSEAFTPKDFFLPLDNDPRNTPPKIEAIGVGTTTFENKVDYDTIGLTRQPCPVEPGWFLARHIPAASADPYERCWMEKGNTVVVRDIDQSTNPATLDKSEEVIDKDRFFAAGTISKTPAKYQWAR
jgi:hypothetical protein